MEQIWRFSKDIKGQAVKIGLFYFEECSDKAKHIASEMLSCLKCEASVVKTIKMAKKWLKKAGRVTHFVIIGAVESKLNKKECDRDIFDLTSRDRKGVSKVIFIHNSSEMDVSPSGFLCLDSDLNPTDLSIRILGHFSGKLFSMNKSCLGKLLIAWQALPNYNDSRVRGGGGHPLGIL